MITHACVYVWVCLCSYVCVRISRICEDLRGEGPISFCANTLKGETQSPVHFWLTRGKMTVHWWPSYFWMKKKEKKKRLCWNKGLLAERKYIYSYVQYRYPCIHTHTHTLMGICVCREEKLEKGVVGGKKKRSILLMNLKFLCSLSSSTPLLSSPLFF